MIMHLHQDFNGLYPDKRDGLTYAMEIEDMAVNTLRGSKLRVVGRQEVSPKFVLLIVEDFDEIRAFLSRHFTKGGYEVFSSSTLRDALAILWEEWPHVIIIDYDLDGESSLHAVERLHDARPESYIVLIGGPGTSDVEERALEAGASKVLSKAYAISEMDQIVERVMNRSWNEDRAFS